MPRPLNALLFGLIEQLRMQVVASLGLRFVLVDRDAMRVGPGILTYSGHLPRNLDAGRAGSDGEAIVADLSGNDGLGKLPDDRELVAKVAIEGLEPIRQSDDCLSGGVCGDVAVIDVHHVWRLDE